MARIVGKIEEKSDLNVTNSNGKSVINFMFNKTRELVAGICESIPARVVMYGELAEKAETEITPGKIVLFSNIQRNPRTYTTEAGTKVETVDLIARGYEVVEDAKYKANGKALEKLCIDVKELEFTAKDRKALTVAATAPVA